MKRPVICVDFDGTLHDIAHPVPGRKMGPPMPGAVGAIKTLCMTHEVVVLTAQPRSAHITDWLFYYGFPRMQVTNVKPQADAYIDDKGIRFVDWHDCLRKVFDYAQTATWRTS